MWPVVTNTDAQCCFSIVEIVRGYNFFILMEKAMRFLSFFAVAVIAAASLAVSGCGGTETAAPTTTDGGGAAAPAEGSSSSTTPATGQGLTAVSFDVTGMT